MSNTTKKYAVIQYGCAVFGLGDSKDSAIIEAAKWVEPVDGGFQGDATIDDVKTLLNHNNGKNVHGCFYLIDSDCCDWSDYVTE